jgi:hypothetical protein
MTLSDARPTGRASAQQILTIPGWKPPPRDRLPLRPILAVAAVLGVIVAGVVFVPRFISRREHPLYDAAPARPAARAPVPPVDSAAASAGTEPARTADRRVRLERRPRGETAAPPPAEAPAATTAPAPQPVTLPPETPRRTEPAAAPAAPAAEAAGRLSVNATPWGQLYLDGQLVGNTPKANLSVVVGTHTIRVVRDGFEPVERTVQVGAGQTVRITDIVLTERRP